MASTASVAGLDGHRALVTGAGPRELHARSATAMAAAGAPVTLVARTESDLDATASTIRAAGGDATIRPWRRDGR